MIKVAIFEDHKLLREGLTMLIDNTPGLTCTGSFADRNKLLKNIDQAQPDVVLMDIQMPGVSGIEAVRLIRSHNGAIRILILTVFEDDEKIFAAICAGVSGYILKKDSSKKIIEAIHEVYNGGAPITGSIANKVLRMFQKYVVATKAEIIQLTSREKEILKSLVYGRSYKMIASYCNISYDTVRFHIKNIYGKLHVKSMTEAVVKAINHHIV